MKLIHKEIKEDVLNIVEDCHFLTELKKSEEKFYQVFDINPSPMSIFDMNSGLIIDVNQSFVKIMGVESKKEIIGKDTSEYINQKNKLAFFEQIKKNGKIENHIFSFKTIKGKKLKGKVSGTIIKLNNQEYLLTICQIINKRCILKYLFM